MCGNCLYIITQTTYTEDPVTKLRTKVKEFRCQSITYRKKIAKLVNTRPEVYNGKNLAAKPYIFNLIHCKLKIINGLPVKHKKCKFK